MRRRIALTALGWLVALGCTAPTERVVLGERSPLSSADEFAARHDVQLIPAEREMLHYELESESFELYEPSTGGAERVRAGVVWISPGGSGAPPRAWAPVLDRLGVAWIGANDSGNARSPPDRIHLALDAAAHLTRRFGEQTPLYVAGFSGGARIASEVALLYSDLFAGGLFAGAADYFRPLRSTDPRWDAWQPTFAPPPAPLLARARSQGRYVLLTGSRDENRARVRDVHGAYRADGISGAILIEVPGLGHRLPPAHVFEQSLDTLFLEPLPADP